MDVVFMKKHNCIWEKDLKSRYECRICDKRPQHPRNMLKHSTPKLYFVKKRPLHQWERLRQKVQDRTETVESVAQSSNFQVHLTDIVNVPIVTIGSENETMNRIIKNPLINNDRHYIKQEDGSNNFTPYVHQNQREEDDLDIAILNINKQN